MRDFICPKCGQHLAFENSVCLSCSSSLGFSLQDMALLVIESGEESAQPGFVDADKYELCANLHLAECNWLVEKSPERKLCTSCALTRTRPSDTDTKALAAFADAERAKRRLVAELFELKLPIIGRDEDPDYGLAFDLLSSEQQKAFTGVNQGALSTRDGKSVVFALRDDKAVEVPVTTGIKVGDLTAISGGVKSGEKVVLNPAPELRTGTLVKVAAK